MPQFTPGPGYFVDTARNVGYMPAPLQQPAASSGGGGGSVGGSSGGGGGGTSGGGGGQSAAEKKAAARKKAAERRRAAAERRRAARERARNPLLRPFRSDAELRAEAARMAALGAPSEETLRGEQAREQAGIEGLTNALTGRISGFVGQTGAGLAGLGNLYGNIVGQARTGAESALAAAGAAPGLVSPAGPSEAVASQMANIGGALAGFVPAAATTGAQIAGTSRSNLTKALADRAATISGNTAKYLQQLRDDEYQRAVTQLTAQQNATRLGLSQQGQEFEQGIALQKLDLDKQRVAQGWYRAEIARAKAQRTGNKNTDARNAKQTILRDLDKWTSSASGLGEYEVSAEFPGEGIQKVTIQAANADEARELARQQYPDTFGSLTNAPINATYGGPAPGAARAADSVWKARVRNYLMSAGGMTRAQADKFINQRVVPSLG